MDDKKLIERVKAHEELYNMDHKSYCDSVHKNGVWLAIGKELKVTGAACKCRWISLRDQLRKVLKKKSETGCKKRWRYEDSMAFIIPFFKEKEPRTYKGVLENVGEESNDEEAIEHNLITTETAPIKPEENEPQNTSKRPVVKAPPWIQSSPNVIPGLIDQKAKNSIEPEMVLMEYLPESRRQATEPTSSPSSAHVIDLFFNGIAATVKTFSPEYQHMAKSRIFAAVSDLEWAYLEGKKPLYSGKCSSTVALPPPQANEQNGTPQGTETQAIDEFTLFSAL